MMTTDENDIVFDPFCGGGSTAVAAKQMGRKYIGADIDKHYCSVARNKLNQSKPVLEYGCCVSIHLRKIISIRVVDVTEHLRCASISMKSSSTVICLTGVKNWNLKHFSPT